MGDNLVTRLGWRSNALAGCASWTSGEGCRRLHAGLPLRQSTWPPGRYREQQPVGKPPDQANCSNWVSPRLIRDRPPPDHGTVLSIGGPCPIRPYLPPLSELCISVHSRGRRGKPSRPPYLRPIVPTSGPIDVFNSDPLLPLKGTTSSDASTIAISKISVIVVAAERLFGFGLARVLDEDEDLDVVAISDGDPDLLGLCTAMSADVVLIDLELSRVDGIDLVRLLASECSNTRTLVLTSNPDWRVRPAMVAGASGVLLKDTSPEAIRAAVRSIHLGDQVLSREAARWILGQDASNDLTPRESAVLRMVAQGASNAEIAVELQLGQKTVRNYVSRLYRKLDLHNRAQIATYLAHIDIARGTNQSDLASPVIKSSVNSK